MTEAFPPTSLRAAQSSSLMPFAKAPIGVFDSGIGGLSVWRHLRMVLPHEDFIYVADNAHVPYGDKSEAWIQARMIQIFDWFLMRGCKAVVIACNTATAMAATYLRNLYPELFIIGLEPAIKPAIQLTKNGTIAMLATARTVDSAKYAALLQRTLKPELNITVLSIPCIGLAELIDTGLMDVPKTLSLIEQYVKPVKKANADVVVLGCTHYLFVEQHIRALLDESVQIIDSGAPVARYTRDVLVARQGLNPQKVQGHSTWYASLLTEDGDAHWQSMIGVEKVRVQSFILPI